MFDIGSIELFIVAALALVVVGPKELPGLIRGIGKAVGTMRGLTSEFKTAINTLASEVEQEKDPYGPLKAKEGLHPGMSPEEITETIMANRQREESAQKAAQEENVADEEETGGKGSA